jgi:hypothetical protein
MAIGLQEVCTAQIDLAPESQDVGPGPFGNRRVLEIVGGRVEGETLSGIVLSGGADWILDDPGGWGVRLDVRMQWRMEDGAILFVSAQGICEFNARVLEARERAEGTSFEDQHYRTLLCIEAGDQKYDWVNRAVFVTEGRISPGATGRGVQNRVFHVV